MRRLLLTIACVVIAVACDGSDDESRTSTAAADVSDPAVAVSDSDSVDDAPLDEEQPAGASGQVGRVDLQASGNRVTTGDGAFGLGAPATLALPSGRTASWLLPSGDSEWLAVLDDGSVIDVALTGDADLTSAPADPSGTIDVDDAPPTLVDGTLVDAATARRRFEDPIPDARVVTDGGNFAALAGPTDRYAHGVLGDEIEASTVEIVAVNGSRSTPIQLDAPDVIEAVSPMLADVDGDGALDIVVTVSNGDVGARIAAYSFGGELISESEPIGTGNRWLNLLAVAPVGPDGQVEVIAVRTPHIGGVLEFFRDDGAGRLERVAATDGYSTHVIGSRNLDLGIVSDADGDGRLDVLLPTQTRDALTVVTRDSTAASGTRVVDSFPLGGELTANTSAAGDGDTGVAYAVGTSDGRILVWPAPDAA